ncbi:MFS transporter [Novipirellula artificiosorum]|uniref:Putative sialic acid transporter n=1 Tax=Novipirellula artificiosorum TaxID=2528016 RepID=A0A5C6DRE9_9BACT|nr:MFS transporter [Novipirellula artificiosorum]TWU37329.1 putative sialic acid transporter [Novipirellula artificiosorum]
MIENEKRSSVFEGVTTYHWIVVLIAAAAWGFDCMDARLFVLARESALTDLLSDQVSDPAIIKTYLGYATTALILGWATGGIVFGMMSDRLGRIKTMVATLLIYSIFTGLSGIAVSWVDFVAYRFLVGLGIGGLFGAATTLVAESVPGSFRPLALGALQVLAAFGNMGGSLISLWIQPGAEASYFGLAGWRVLFFVGILPSLLVVPIIFFLREPDAWLAMRAATRHSPSAASVGSPITLFRDARWRRNTIVGLMLGVAGMVGLWGIGFFSPELISTALKGEPQSHIDKVRAWGTASQDVGAFFGMMTFTFVASFLSRRLAFLGAFLLSFFTTVYVFNNLNSAADAYWMLPMMGFAQFSLFAGYSIYFPELFPTRLRGLGVGFCYNTVRYLAAPAPILLGWMSTMMSFRTAAALMASIYLVGAVALLWAPETKGKPLPEDTLPEETSCRDQGAST